MEDKSNKLVNFTTINILDELESELKILLDYELYTSALFVALSIPDFMGRIAYPTIKKSSTRYVKWFNDNFIDFMGYTPSDYPLKEISPPNLNGKLCYALRCKLLHEGHDDLKDLNIDEFVLVREKEGFVRGTNGGADDNFVQLENGQWTVELTNYQYISIRELVNGLLKGAINYRRKHDIENQLTRLKINNGGGKIPNCFSTDYFKKFKKK